MAAIEASAPIAAPVTAFWTRGRRAGAAYLVVGLLAAIFWGFLGGHGGVSTFTTGLRTIAPDIGASFDVPARLSAAVLGLVGAAAGAALLAERRGRWFKSLSAVAIAGIVLSFVCWQDAGKAMPIGGTAQLSVVAALPLIFGSLAGVLGERSGVINVAIEGQFLTGAFLGALIGSLTGSAWLGLVGAVAGGLIIAALLAVLAIRFSVDQVVLGVLLNLLALGVTSFLYLQIMQPDQATFNVALTLPTWKIPGLSAIPILGPTLFDGTILLYLAIVLVIGVHFALFHTRWGLRTRAVGEHPTAADTVGINVIATRYRNVLAAGLIAGLGGAYFTIASGHSFSQNMTNGNGFIALAALIFGRWSPVGATLAALLFGFAGQLGYYLETVLSPIPSQFLAMLPYLVTIFAVAGLVGRVRAPAADGQPYTKS